MKPDSGWHRLYSRLEAGQLVVDDPCKAMKRWETPPMERTAELLHAGLQRTRIDETFFDTSAEDATALVDENVSLLVEAAPHLKPGAAVALFWMQPTTDEVRQEESYRHYRRIVIEAGPPRARDDRRRRTRPPGLSLCQHREQVGRPCR
ncbi:hypothetical protein AB0H63_10850 [Micromonospora echinospora]|uniref:hypothetical protein n=1 Tax=Micromonospora echinospora TaxID=1877 RepID=UPI003410794E